MIIKDIKVSEISIPLVTPFKTALRTVACVNDILIQIETDTDQVGLGEAPPTAVITGDTKGSIITAITEFILPAVRGLDIEDIDGIMSKISRCMQKNSSAKAAVDMAVYDLYAKNLKKPLYKVLGGHGNEVETDLTISVNPVDVMVADSLKAVAAGFRILKVKVGKEGLKDIARIQAIREALGPSVKIRVDANQGWTAKDAVRIITAMDRPDSRYKENQPASRKYRCG